MNHPDSQTSSFECEPIKSRMGKQIETEVFGENVSRESTTIITKILELRKEIEEKE